MAEVQARLAIARHLDTLHQTDRAIETLETLTALRPTAPYASLPRAYLRLGEAYDRMGLRASALEAYRLAAATATTPDPYDVRAIAAEHLRRAPDPKRAEAYRLSLEGWRRLEQNDLTAASAALERSIALNGSDPVARYRLGRVLQARKDDGAALAQFEHAIRGAKSCPAPILGTAYLEAARLYERVGRRDRAIASYRTASALFGAAADTRTAATRALTRLRAR